MCAGVGALAKQSRRFEQISGAFLVLRVRWISYNEVDSEDLGIELKIVVQLRREQTLVSSADAKAFIFNIIDDDFSVVLHFVEDGFLERHFEYLKWCWGGSRDVILAVSDTFWTEW